MRVEKQLMDREVGCLQANRVFTKSSSSMTPKELERSVGVSTGGRVAEADEVSDFWGSSLNDREIANPSVAHPSLPCLSPRLRQRSARINPYGLCSASG